MLRLRAHAHLALQPAAADPIVLKPPRRGRSRLGPRLAVFIRMLQMTSRARRVRCEPDHLRGGPSPAAVARTPKALLAVRLLLLAGRVHEAEQMLDGLAPELREGAAGLELTVHLKHARGALTEAIDALERAAHHRCVGPAGLQHVRAPFDAKAGSLCPAHGLDLSLEELLIAACDRFLPLHALIPLLPPGHDLAALRRSLSDARSTATALGHTSKALAATEQLALLEALDGRHEQSATLWRALMTGAQPRAIHAKYFAEVCARSGDRSGASALYLAGLAQEAGAADPEVLTQLLDAPDPSTSALLAQLFAQQERAQATVASLRARARAEASQPEPWRLTAGFVRTMGDPVLADRLQLKAERLEEHRDSASIGKVKSVAAYSLAEHQYGFVHDIWVSRSACSEGGLSVLGNIADDMARDIDNVYEATRKYVQENFPHLAGPLEAYRYTIKVSKDDRPSDGNSAGLALALAFLSRFLDLPMPQDIAFTGRLVVDSASRLRVAAVGAVDAKALGAYFAGMRSLFAPRDTEGEVATSRLAPRDFWSGRVIYVADLDEVLDQVFGDSLWEL